MDDLCADFNQFHHHGSQRPEADRLWQGQPLQEVAKIICQHKQGKPNLIADKPFAGYGINAEPRIVELVTKSPPRDEVEFS